jgi:hypothetical protein
MNKHILICSAIAGWTAMCLTAPAFAQYNGASIGGHGTPEQYGSPHEMPDKAFRPFSFDASSKAEDLRLKGQCDKAVPILRNLIAAGAKEISQYNLGMCLLDLAAKDPQHAKDMQQEAVTWIVSAANTGLAKAQSLAVTLYTDGTGTPVDLVEAKKWALIYRGNPLRYSFGLPDIPDSVNSKIDAALTDAQRADARKRANAWTQTAVSADQ